MDTPESLAKWVRAAHDVVVHISCARGATAPYYHLPPEPLPWPAPAIEIVNRDTPMAIDYFVKQLPASARGSARNQSVKC